MYLLPIITVFYLLIIVSSGLLPIPPIGPIVKVSSGSLQGNVLLNDCQEPYFGFHGIPYAKPPINTLRFKSPQPPNDWSGIRMANLQGNECVQRSLFTNSIIGNEDCLYANVFTKHLPNDTNTSLKPVLVFIHGGGFGSGSSDNKQYGSIYLMCEDIVLVTFNYRLNIFGFLSFDDPSVNVPGNAGLKDQVQLLRWVQENIKQFSGDPNKVTIFGQSAGAASVNLLMLSPLAKGLFHRAISNSGTALQPFVFTPRRYRELARLLKYNGDISNQKQIFEFFMKFDAATLLKAQKRLRTTFLPYLGDRSEMVVTVENEIGNADPFITSMPEKIIANKQYNDVPYLLGFNSEEGAFFLKWDTNVHYNFSDEQDTIPRYLRIEKNTPKAFAFGKKIKEFYYGNQMPSYNNLMSYYNMMTDSIYSHKISEVARTMAMNSKSPIYFYEFSYKTQLNWASRYFARTPQPATSHCDDLGYLFFNILNVLPVSPNSDAGIGRHRMIKFWTNFAKYGDPNSKTNDPLLNVTWLPINKEHFYYLNIDKDMSLRENPIQNRLLFWDNIEQCAATTQWRECLQKI
ncbi:juvenile hormone esterase-like isoform X2 [Chrysoperla carnea]|uniref:juvenile hormone esterase-like isoform X2 n=1 Tax=Chrysoperla carnea TaxID=189513 RepID=UPI001D077F60|nr:juvenile hormone esterase-like isoform X2 [Chrysoperla carnea]